MAVLGPYGINFPEWQRLVVSDSIIWSKYEQIFCFRGLF
jgi:hypothetical protein